MPQILPIVAIHHKSDIGACNMEVTQRGETTTVKVDGRVFKITYSARYRRLQIRENGRLLNEAHNLQEALNLIDRLAQSVV